MLNINIVHLSNTPLAGAPGRISHTLKKAGLNSIHICLTDYPAKNGLAGKFIDNTMIYNSSEPLIKEFIDEIIENANIIHIHNDISPDFLEKIKHITTQAKFIYHVHSPLREGPLYFERALHYGIEFDKLLVVAQYHPRHYENYTPVPNLVLTEPSLNLIKDGEKIRVIYSPTHTRGGRWNSKFSDELTTALTSLANMNKIQVITPQTPVNQETLFEMRKQCHITIDEISTGAYHQISLEGLCAGNVVINRADFFSKAMLASVSKAEELPPFINADPLSIGDVLLNLSMNYDTVRKYQTASYDYFDKHLRPSVLIGNYIKEYSDVWK